MPTELDDPLGIETRTGARGDDPLGIEFATRKLGDAQGIRTDTGQSGAPGLRPSAGQTDRRRNPEQAAPQQPQSLAQGKEEAPQKTLSPGWSESLSDDRGEPVTAPVAAPSGIDFTPRRIVPGRSAYLQTQFDPRGAELSHRPIIPVGTLLMGTADLMQGMTPEQRKDHYNRLVVGLGEGLRKNLDALTTPENLTLMGVGGAIGKLGPLAARAVSAAFAGLVAKNLPETWKRWQEHFAKPADERDSKEIGELVSDSAAQLAIVGGAGYGAVRGFGPKAKPTTTEPITEPTESKSEPVPAPEPSPGELEYPGGEMPSYTEPGQGPVPETKPDEVPTAAPVEAPGPEPTPAPAPVAKGEMKPRYTVRADSKEFDRLVLDHAVPAQWTKNPDLLYAPDPGRQQLGSIGITHRILQAAEMKRVRAQATKELGLDPDQIGNPTYRAQALPKLKTWLDEKFPTKNKQAENFDKATEAGKEKVPVEKLKVGDALNIKGEPVKVTDVDAEGNVTLENGTKFGTQVLKDGTTIYAEEWHPSAEGKFEPEPPTPKLRPGEKGTGEFLQGAEQPFNLAGEPAIDAARIAAEKAKTEKTATEAKVIAAKQQLTLPGTEPGPATVEGPGIVGMGGAIPAEFEPGGGRPSSNKNAVVDRERGQRGLSPMMAALKHTWGQAWNEAMSKIDSDPGWQDRLIADLQSNPRALTDVENVGLLHRRVDLRNEMEKSMRDGAQAYQDVKAGFENRESALTEARLRVAEWSDKLSELEEATKSAGTESGRSMAARKMMMNEDFSPGAMEMRLRAAKGFEPLTDAERTKLLADLDRLKADSEATQKYLAEREQKLAELEIAKTHAELIAKNAPRFDKRILAQAEKIVVAMENAAKPAADRLRNRLSRMTTGVDPTIISDAAIVGSAKIARLGLDLAKFTDAMVADFTDKIRPFINEIWEASNRLLEASISKVPDPVKRVVKATASAEEKKTTIKSNIKDTLGKGKLDEASVSVHKLARIFVEQGIRERDALIDAVHDALKEIDPQITRRETMDAISGYGKFKRLPKDQISLVLRDLKGQMQQVAKLEDMKAGEAPLKTGLERRSPSDAERQLIKLVNEEKKKGAYTVTDPESQLVSTQMTRLKYYRNRMADIQDELANKQPLIKQRRLPVTNPEIESLKSEYQKLKSERDTLFNTALEGYKNRTRKRIAEMEEKIRTGNFDPRPRKPLPILDKEATRLMAQEQRTKDRLADARRSAQLRQRSAPQKVLDFFSKWLRREFVLSSPSSIVKLTSAAIQGLTLEPVKEVVGAGIAKVIPGFAKRLQVEAPSSVGIEVKAFREAFMNVLNDAAQTLRTGKSDLEVKFGGRRSVPEEMTSYFGRLHAALKTPLKRAAFSRVFDKLATQEIRAGVDVTDELVQMRIGNLAMKEANRMLFLEDNKLVSAYSRFLSAFEQKLPDTGKPSTTGYIAAAALRWTLPVVRIPTNLVARTIQAAAGFPVGAAKLAYRYAKGIQDLPNEQADLIMRQLKQGSVGAAMLVLGYFSPQLFGGYYQPGEKRKPSDVGVGKLRSPIGDVPAYLQHHPLLQVAQLGATIRRVSDSHLRNKDPRPQGLAAGAMSGLLGLIEEAPFAREMIDLSKIRDPRQRDQVAGSLVESMVVPQGVQWTAKELDKPAPFNPFQNPAKRKPRNIAEHVEMGIPGLRQKVPAKYGSKPITPEQVRQYQSQIGRRP